MGYLDDTSERCLCNVFDERDLTNMTMETYTDSDHAGDPASSKSTSGGVIRLTGSYGTCALIGFLSRRQGAVSQSTAEAEIVAVNDSLRNLTINYYTLAEIIFSANALRNRIFVDSQAAIGAIKNGYGPCRYMKKTQRVSLGWILDAR